MTTMGAGPKAPRFVNNVAIKPRYVTDLYHSCKIVQNVHEYCILLAIMVVKDANTCRFSDRLI